jgi:hypothetical protein
MKKMNLCLSVAAISALLLQVSAVSAQGSVTAPGVSVSDKGIFLPGVSITEKGVSVPGLTISNESTSGVNTSGATKSVTTQSGTKPASNVNTNRSGVSGTGKCVDGLLRVVSNGLGDSSYSKLSCDKVEVVLTNIGKVTVGEIAAKTVSLNSSGSGEISVGKLTSNQLDVVASSLGDVNIEQGSAPTLVVTLKNIGSLKASKLISQNVKATLSGSGNAEVYASQSIEGELSSLGDLIYTGGATTVSANASNIGTIKKM